MNCEKCGVPIPENGTFCPNCGAPAQKAPAAAPEIMSDPAPEALQKPENVFGGIIGALVGAVIGAACIILLSQLGFVAALSGVVLAICTLKGYELLGHRLSGTGLVICIALMLITPYIADRIDLTIQILKEFPEYELEFFDIFQRVPDLIGDVIIEEAYYEGLIKLYAFTALGGVGTIIDKFKKKK